MWIAKPIDRLTSVEKELWHHIEERLPLAQTLCWGRATQALSPKTFLIFSPEESVGGIVFCTPNSGFKSHYECTNGPYLKWDCPEAFGRQIATFATALSRLDPQLGSLKIRPRWNKGQSILYSQNSPVPLYRQSESATLVVPIQSNAQLQFQALKKRLRRSLHKTWQAGIEVKLAPLSFAKLERFHPGLALYGQKKGFTVPPFEWFSSLLKDPYGLPRYWLITATSSDQLSQSQILLCERKDTLHYLFGFEKRDENLSSSVSQSGAAHWEALLFCQKQRIKNYDLNGYLVSASPDHAYFGVAQFKEQFAGQIIEYESPEFVITT